MSLPAGAIAGGAVLAAILVLAFRRPILARIGAARATERPRQLALVALGLMVATSVTTAATVAAESIGDSQGEAALARIGGTDVVVQTRPEAAMNASERSRLLGPPNVTDRMARTAPALRMPIAVEDERSRLGEPEVPVWGIDPSAAKQLGQLDVREGQAPPEAAQWEDGIVVNRELAERLDAEIGDTLEMFVDRPAEPSQAMENRSGRLVLASRGPDGGYTHAPGDEYVFEVSSPDRALGLAFAARPQPPGSADLDLEIVSPEGQRLLLDNGTTAEPQQPRTRIGGPSLVSGDWEVRVHAKQAAGTDVQLRVVKLLAPEDRTQTTSFEGELIGIVEDAGSDPVDAGPAAFVPHDRLAGTMGLEDETNVVLAQAAYDEESQALDDAIEASAEESGRDDVRVLDVRSQAQETAEEGSPWLRMFLLTLGSFSILAGFLLVVVLVAMLVEERREELATLRAIGARRRSLTQALLHEGAVYAVLAGLLGLASGIGLAWFIVETAEGFSFYGGTELSLTLAPATLLGSLGVGFALTVLAAGTAAHRESGVSIVEALKGERSRNGGLGWTGWAWRGLVLAAGLGGCIAWALTGNAVLAVLGPSLALLGAAGLAGQFVGPRTVYPLAGLALVGYVTATFFVFTDLEGDLGLLLMPARGLLVTLGASLVLVYSRVPARVFGWIAGRVRDLKAVADTAAQYARQRPTRAMLTVSMVGLVVLVLVMTSTVTAMLAPNLSGQLDGVDVVATSRSPLSGTSDVPEDPQTIEGVQRWIQAPLAREAARGASVGDDRVFAENRGRGAYDVLATTPGLAEAGVFEARTLAADVDSLSTALEAIAGGGNRVVVADTLQVSTEEESRTLEPGDVLELDTRDGEVNVTVAGVIEGGAFGGVLASPDVVAELDSEPVTRVFVDTTDGAQPGAVADRIERAYRPAGLDAQSVEAAEERARSDARTQTLILEIFLGTGLLVGIAAIGLVTARNVLERRQQVGTLRAMGASRGQVLGLFVVETLVVVTMGVAIGFGGGLLLAYGAYLNTFQETGALFAPAWGNLALLVGVAYLAALVAAWIPARRASGMPPAQAVRAADD